LSANLDRHIFDPQFAGVTEQNHVFDDTAELTHIAGPGISPEQGQPNQMPGQTQDSNLTNVSVTVP